MTILNQMNIYVAGGFPNRHVLRDFMSELERQGHKITHDWTSYELVYTDRHTRSVKCAKADITGVCNADLVIAVMTDSDYEYKGTRHELGASFSLQEMKSRGLLDKAPKVYIVCDGDPTTDHVDDLYEMLF